MKRKGFTLIELMIVIAIIAVIAAIAIPGMLASIRAANERNAQASLKTLATAQADFRANDHDGNRMLDFWTGDVAGLYTVAAASEPTNPIKLIDLVVAGAEAAPYAAGVFGLPVDGNQAVNLDISTLVQQRAKSGYWYNALLMDNSASGGPQAYATDTDGSGALCKNNSRFGAVAWPDALGSSGNWVFIISEGNSVFKARPPSTVVLKTGTLPPGIVADPNYQNWPSSAVLGASWAGID